MCGPIAFLLPVDRQNSAKKIGQITLYHLGRLLSYSILGVLFGWLGKGLYLFGFQQQLSVAIGILMLVALFWSRQKMLNFKMNAPVYRIISRIKSALSANLKKRSADTFFTIGFLNGFLPCGLVYMAIFAAIASGSMLQGGLYMAVFGLGTIPLMTSAIYVSGFLTANIRNKIQRVIPIFVGIMALLFIIRGLGLGIPYLSPAPVMDMATAHMSCH